MNKSESIAALAGALAKAQGTIKGAVKDSANPFFKSKYADLASVVEAIRAAFSANGLAYTQCVEPSDKDEVRVSTIIMHSSGEWMNCGTLALPVSKADAQGFGSALTYARRYSLSAAVGVAPEDDDGNAAAKAAPAKPLPIVTQVQATTGAWEALDAENQTFLLDIAMEVVPLLDAGKAAEAMAYINKQNLDADDKTALWTRFDSKQRSAMKKAAQPIQLAEVA